MVQSGPDFSLAEIAAAISGELVGDGSRRVVRLLPPQCVEGAGDLALAIEPASLAALEQSPATAAVVASDAAVPATIVAAIRVVRPRLAMATLLRLFAPTPSLAPGVHPAAWIDPTATVGPGSAIGAFTYVGPDAAIGSGCTILSQVTIGAGAALGEGCLIHAGVRIGERVTLGRRVILQPNLCQRGDGVSYLTHQPCSIQAARCRTQDSH